MLWQIMNLHFDFFFISFMSNSRIIWFCKRWWVLCTSPNRFLIFSKHFLDFWVLQHVESKELNNTVWSSHLHLARTMKRIYFGFTMRVVVIIISIDLGLKHLICINANIWMNWVHIINTILCLLMKRESLNVLEINF